MATQLFAKTEKELSPYFAVYRELLTATGWNGLELVMVEKAKDLGVDISLQALAHKLIRQHLTHLELKRELARVNALGGGGDIPESLNGHG